MMVKSDSSQRFIFEGEDVRGELVYLSQSFKELLSNKEYPDSVRDLLGEFLVASVLLSTTIKFDGRLVLQARSNGIIPLIMAECTSQQTIRGIARFIEDEQSDDFAALLNKGTLAITIEPDKGEAYQGIVPLEKRDLAHCLQDYFVRSEQLDTRFFLAVSEDRCAGLLLQQLPAQMDMNPDSREDAWDTLIQLASTVTADELLELENEQVLYRLFNQHKVKTYPEKLVRHQCSCSRERTASALFVIGEEEVMDIVAEQGKVEINCEFCGKQYCFEPGELKLLFENRPDDVVH